MKPQLYIQVKNTLISAVIFFIVTMPFRELFGVMEVTEMRPAGALPPVLGLMLGVPGALGCAIGNFIADIVSGYGIALSVTAFPAQFIYGLVPWAAWTVIKKLDGSTAPFFRLSNARNVLIYVGLVSANAVLSAVMIGGVFAIFGFAPFFSYATLMVLYNNLIFCVVLGIPIIAFMSLQRAKTEKMRVSINERLALILLVAAIVVSFITGAFAFRDLSLLMDNQLEMWLRIYLYVLISMFAMFLFVLAALRYTEKSISIPLETITNLAEHYINAEELGTYDAVSQCGNLSKIDNEVGVLANAFRKMFLSLDTYIGNLRVVTAENERIGTELDVATKMQASMLPRFFQPILTRAEFDIYAKLEPSKEVGGDFYDFFLIDHNTLAVVMVDIAGKGVPATLFTIIIRTLIKNNALSGYSPKDVLEAVNTMLCENNEGMAASAILGYLDIKSGRFTFTSAGHTPPLRRHGLRYSWLERESGLMLAGAEGTTYKQHEVVLNPGDEIILYTDGIVDAKSIANEPFGKNRLLDAANKCLDLPLEEVIASIKGELDHFTDSLEYLDDIAMLVLRYQGDCESVLSISVTQENLPEMSDFVGTNLTNCTVEVHEETTAAADRIFAYLLNYAQSPGTGDVVIRIEVSEFVKIEFEDSRILFDPSGMSDAEYLREGTKNLIAVVSGSNPARH